MEMDADDPDQDPVVGEIDVFISQNLAGMLYIMQYPLRPPWRPYNMQKVQEVRVKPVNQKFELDIELDTDNVQYDSESAQKLRTLTLSSSLVPAKTNYAIGLLRNDQLHLTPVEGIVQFRPSYGYIDEAEAKKKSAKKAADAEAALEDEESDDLPAPTGPTEHQPVQIMIKKRETEKAIDAHRNSYAFLKQKEDEEPWQCCTLRLPDSAESEATLFKLLSPGAAPLPFPLSPSTYLSLINPLTEPVALTLGQPKDSQGLPLSQHMLRGPGVPVETQLVHLLSHAQVLSLERICSIIQRSPADTLPTLERIGCLVRGNWLLSSGQVYPNSSQLHMHLAACRDYVLLQYATDEGLSHLSRPALADVCKLHTSHVKEVLEGVARLVPTVGWVFMRPTDHEFILRYPQIVARQQKLWQERSQRIIAQLQSSSSQHTAQQQPSTSSSSSLSSSRPSPAARSRQSSASAPVPSSSTQEGGREEVSSGRKGSTSKAEVGASIQATVRQAANAVVPGAAAHTLADVLCEVFQTFGVVSFGFLRQRMDAIASQKADVATLLESIEDADIQEVLSSVCITLHNSYVLKSLGNPTVDQYRNIVVELFRNKPAVKKAEIKAAAMAAVGEDIPPAHYSKIMKELSTSRGAMWLFKQGDGMEPPS